MPKRLIESAGTISLDHAIAQLRAATTEFETATSVASAATSRKNAAKKDQTKWARIVVAVHEQPTLQLDAEVAERIGNEAIAQHEADEAVTADGEPPAGPHAWTAPTRGRAGDEPPPLDKLADALSKDLTDPVRDPDVPDLCVCGWHIASKAPATLHQTRHAAFIERVRSGDALAREHGALAAANAGIDVFTELQAVQNAKPERGGKKTPRAGGKPSRKKR